MTLFFCFWFCRGEPGPENDGGADGTAVLEAAGLPYQGPRRHWTLSVHAAPHTTRLCQRYVLHSCKNHQLISEVLFFTALLLGKFRIRACEISGLSCSLFWLSIINVLIKFLKTIIKRFVNRWFFDWLKRKLFSFLWRVIIT